jgi:FKBP-type peptidyl-prolyl cis-trans isomerase FkpA
MKLYIPPFLAYGSKEIKDDGGNVIIPANSILIFDLTLNSFY